MGWFMQIKLTPPLFSLAPPHPAPSLEFSGTHPFRWHSHHDIPRKSLNKALLARGWCGGRLRCSSFSRRGGAGVLTDGWTSGAACGSLERCVSFTAKSYSAYLNFLFLSTSSRHSVSREVGATTFFFFFCTIVIDR